MPKKVTATYNILNNCYDFECPTCEKKHVMNLSMEEEMALELGYRLQVECNDCGQDIKVFID